MNRIEKLTGQLNPLTSAIIHHPIYAAITSLAHLRLFMEQHVFAVWDFMCLLKELHRRLVTTASPWFPPKDALSANLISSLLIEEEADLTEDGSHYASHYDMYLESMEKIEANTYPIKKLLSLLREGVHIAEAIELIPIPSGTKQFVLTTFSFFELEAHQLAAAFVYGREGITASMFYPLLQQLKTKMSETEQNNLGSLMYYFKRHIQLDNDEHFPKALKMLSNLIGDNEKKYQETEVAATQALQARINFLTDLHRHLLGEGSSISN